MPTAARPSGKPACPAVPAAALGAGTLPRRRLLASRSWRATCLKAGGKNRWREGDHRAAGGAAASPTALLTVGRAGRAQRCGRCGPSLRARGRAPARQRRGRAASAAGTGAPLLARTPRADCSPSAPAYLQGLPSSSSSVRSALMPTDASRSACITPASSAPDASCSTRRNARVGGQPAQAGGGACGMLGGRGQGPSERTEEGTQACPAHHQQPG